MRIILGSQSRSRSSILEKAGYVFETRNPDIDEKSIRHNDPTALTLALAHAKIDAVLKDIKEPVLLITSDQVVSWNGQILEKPENPDQARAFLQGYAIHPAEIVTSVVVLNTGTGKRCGGTDIAKVWFHAIEPEVIEILVSDETTYTRAGGFGIQDPRLQDSFIQIEGSMDSVMGLPMDLTKKLLEEARA